MSISTDTHTDDYTAVLQLPVPPQRAAELFASPEGVSAWWGPATGDAEVGGTLAVAFGKYGVNAVRVLQRDLERVVWQSIDLADGRGTQHTAEWAGTTIEFDLSPTAEGTELRFRHRGLTPTLVCWDDCFAGWTHFLASIDTWARTGVGTPFGS
ncbi:MAG: SRPBCC family protein [Jatrophihabitans sp.]|uniref:SRPBCC family protein n=1 Tax=Jatrophihabitans sp. TaxID=1932789 RepID=UPI003F8106FE